MNMQHFLKESRIFVYCLVAGAVGAVVGSGLWAEHSPALAPVAAATSTTLTPGSIETSFAPIVERALPAVVNISSSKMSKVSAQNTPFEMDPFFRQFFGRNFEGNQNSERPRRQLEHSLGSGVIVDKKGFILTNHHVIDQATKIQVVFNGDTTPYTPLVMAAVSAASIFSCTRSRSPTRTSSRAAMPTRRAKISSAPC